MDLDDAEYKATRKLNGLDKDIQVGEYVRLKDGQIFKIDENITNYYNSNKEYITNEITKHSPNLIDLIEVNDYVNGCLVIRGFSNCITVMSKYGLQTYTFKDIISEKFGNIINTVVTHEQFNSVMYKVKE